jgi:hypothetical protein
VDRLPGAAGGLVAGEGAVGVWAQATDALKERARPMASEARIRDLMVNLLVDG